MTRPIWRIVALLVLCLPCCFITRTSLGDSGQHRTTIHTVLERLSRAFDREAKKYKDLSDLLDAVATEILETQADTTLEISEREAKIQPKKALQSDLQADIKLQLNVMHDLSKQIYKVAKSQKTANRKR